MKRNEGFTLVHLMAIVAIMCIIAAAVIHFSFRYKESQETKAQEQAVMFALKNKSLVVTDASFDGISTDDAGKKRIYYVLETSDKQVRLPIDEFAMNETAEVSFIETITEDETGEVRHRLTFSVDDLWMMITPFLKNRGVYEVFAANSSLIFKGK